MAIESEENDLKVEREDLANNTSFLFILRNFGVGDDRLRERHKIEVARIASILTFLGAPNLVAVYGLASRSGAADRNLQLSKQRVGSVNNELILRGVPFTTVFNPLLFEIKSFGEDFAESLGVADGDEDPRARAVEVFVWPDIAAKRIIFADKKIRQFAATRPLDVFPALT